MKMAATHTRIAARHRTDFENLKTMMKNVLWGGTGEKYLIIAASSLTTYAVGCLNL